MRSTREEVYSAWVPDLPEDEYGMPWTFWAKPVLFATLATATGDDLPRARGVTTGIGFPGWERDRYAVVIDLPGAESVRRGLEFAAAGFRPVPLFNGCPGPGEVIATAEICDALRDAAAQLRELRIDDDAPPVFLLDARRMLANLVLRPGLFDNRWLTFPQDFPSANLLRARGIDRVLLIQEKAGQPQNDLAHVLRRWQEAGVRIAVAGGALATVAEELEVNKPSRFRSLWYRLRATMGLFPNSAGGFGAVIPQPSSG